MSFDPTVTPAGADASSPPAGRVIAIGDIHGCDMALEKLLDMLRPSRQDTLVVLGDVVDRGSGSRRVIDQLLEISLSCQLVTLMGNHEEMLLDAIRNPGQQEIWLRHGGREALASYGGSIGNIPPWHIDFLMNTCDYAEAAGHVFVHANLEPGVAIDRQSIHWLRWQKLTGLETPLADGRRVICGHTVQRSGLPLVWDGWVCLDTGCYAGRTLTALDVGSDLLYQSTQLGEQIGPIPLAALGP